MSAHTPGPWTFENANGRDHTLPSDVAFSVRSGGDLLAGVRFPIAGKAGVIAQANARLIAAAPDLLSCLKEAVASWGFADQDDDAEPGDGDPLAEWKAAIAKAEGRG